MKRAIAVLCTLTICFAFATASAAGKLNVVQEDFHYVESYWNYGYVYAKVENVGDKPIGINAGVFEIYDEICKIGRRGNVTVLRASPVGSALLYAGRKDVCPYPREKKLLLGKYYYLEAR